MEDIRAQDDEDTVIISAKNLDLVDDKFLIYVAFLQLQGRKFELSRDFGEIIGCDINTYSVTYWKRTPSCEVSTYLILLVAMIEADLWTINIGFAEAGELLIKLDQKQINDLLATLDELRFPPCTIHATIESMRASKFQKERDIIQEITRKKHMFETRTVTDEFENKILNFVGLGRDLKSARRV